MNCLKKILVKYLKKVIREQKILNVKIVQNIEGGRIRAVLLAQGR